MKGIPGILATIEVKIKETILEVEIVVVDVAVGDTMAVHGVKNVVF